MTGGGCERSVQERHSPRMLHAAAMVARHWQCSVVLGAQVLLRASMPPARPPACLCAHPSSLPGAGLLRCLLHKTPLSPHPAPIATSSLPGEHTARHLATSSSTSNLACTAAASALPAWSACSGPRAHRYARAWLQPGYGACDEHEAGSVHAVHVACSLLLSRADLERSSAGAATLRCAKVSLLHRGRSPHRHESQPRPPFCPDLPCFPRSASPPESFRGAEGAAGRGFDC